MPLFLFIQKSTLISSKILNLLRLDASGIDLEKVVSSLKIASKNTKTIIFLDIEP